MGGPWDFSVSPRPLGSWFLGFGAWAWQYIAPTCSVFISWHRIQKEEGSNKLIDTINIQDLRVLNCSQCELLWMRYLWFFMMIMWHKKQIYISHYTRDHLAQDFYSRHKNISSAEKTPRYPSLDVRHSQIWQLFNLLNNLWDPSPKCQVQLPNSPEVQGKGLYWRRWLRSKVTSLCYS